MIRMFSLGLGLACGATGALALGLVLQRGVCDKPLPPTVDCVDVSTTDERMLEVWFSHQLSVGRSRLVGSGDWLCALPEPDDDLS